MTDRVDWSTNDQIAKAQEWLWNLPQWADHGTHPQYGSLGNNQIVAVHGIGMLGRERRVVNG